MNPDLLTREEAAKILRISPRTLDKLKARGDIPYSKMGNGIRARVVFQRKDIEDYVQRQRISSDRRDSKRKH